MLQLPWHLYHIAMAFYSMIGGHPDNPQDCDPCCSRPQGARPGKLNKVNAWVNLNLCLCHKVFFSSRVALSASLTLVAHIHTPPLHEKGVGAFRTLHTSPGQYARAATGEWKGWSTNNVCMGGLRVSHCVPFIWAAQGLLWGSPGLQNRGEQDLLRIYGFEGEPGGRGGGVTRIRESKRRR